MAYSTYCLICGGTACESSKADEIYRKIADGVKEKKLEEQVQVVKTGCFGFCEQGPIVKVLPDESFYVQVVPRDADEIVEEHLNKGRPIDRLQYKEKAAI